VNLADLPPVLTVEEAMPILRLSRGSCYQGIREGSIPSIRVGRSIRIPRRALLELLGEPLETREAGFPGLEPLADENNVNGKPSV
jgi:excisionase family DNA binding protein